MNYGADNFIIPDKNGNLWCAYTQKVCRYATVSGQCSMSACINHGKPNIAYGTFDGTLSSTNTLPDEIVLNGVKYGKIE